VTTTLTRVTNLLMQHSMSSQQSYLVSGINIHPGTCFRTVVLVLSGVVLMFQQVFLMDSRYASPHIHYDCYF